VDQRFLCCLGDATDIGDCQKGTLQTFGAGLDAEGSDANVDFWQTSVDVSTSGKVFRKAYDISHTGVYYTVISNCDGFVNGGSTNVEGELTWLSPAGFLPGKFYGLRAFFAVMTILYMIAALCWAIASACYWRELQYQQGMITALLVLGTSEMILWDADYNIYNDVGIRPAGITIGALVIGAIKKGASRLLVLLLSMGHGTVKPFHCSSSVSKAAVLTFLYIVACIAAESQSQLWQGHDVEPRTYAIFQFPVTMMEVSFLLWVFSALRKLMYILEEKNQTAKLAIFKLFSRTLLLFVVTSVLWTGFEVYADLCLRAALAFGRRRA
jgi:hypothetical protein